MPTGLGAVYRPGSNLPRAYYMVFNFWHRPASYLYRALGPLDIFTKPEFNYIQYPTSEPTNRCTPECRACLPEVGWHTARQQIIIYNTVHKRQRRTLRYVKYIYTLYTKQTWAREPLNSSTSDQYRVPPLTARQRLVSGATANTAYRLTGNSEVSARSVVVVNRLQPLTTLTS